jgi:hypothetical protein
LASLSQLVSLFKNTDQIEINPQLKQAFAFLAEQLDNKTIQKTCRQVTSKCAIYYGLSSKKFSNLHSKPLENLFDFTIIINKKPFPCNSSFASCLSNKIFEVKRQNSTINEIEFDNLELDFIQFPSNTRQILTPTNFQEALNFLSKPIFLIMHNNLTHLFKLFQIIFRLLYLKFFQI